jgi:hypothetical protein
MVTVGRPSSRKRFVSGRARPASGNAGVRADGSNSVLWNGRSKSIKWPGDRTGSESYRQQGAICRILDRKFSSAADLLVAV